jgi:hypothetical protein
MREDISIGRDIIDLLGETIADRGDDHADPVESTPEKPIRSRLDHIWCHRPSDNPLYETKYLENKCKKYTRCDELRNRRYDKESLGRYISLDDAERDIETKCDEIGKSEKYPHQCDILEEKCKEKYHRKMKHHPDKTLKRIRDIKIAESISLESCLSGDHDGIELGCIRCLIRRIERRAIRGSSGFG